MKRSLSLFLTVMLVTAAAGAALAGKRSHGPNLTPEQTEKMQQIRAESHAAMNPVMQQIHAKRAELKAQIYSPTQDTAAMEALAKELGVLQGKLYAEKANMSARLVKEGLPAGFRGGHGPGKGHGDAKGRGRGMRGHGLGKGGCGLGKGGCGPNCVNPGNDG